MKDLSYLKDLLMDRRTLYLVIVTNILGTLFGFYYYLPQISENNPLFWIFIMDSPLSTLFIATSLLLHIKNRQKKFLDYLAFIGNFKYGIWTVFVLFHYFESFLAMRGTLLFSFLAVSHLLMFFQAFLVLDYLEFDYRYLAAAASFFLVNDILDYGLGIHSTLPEVNGFTDPAGVAAVSLTALSVSSLLYFKKKGNMV
jgi:uncharacterized membrane protein YpjA